MKKYKLKLSIFCLIIITFVAFLPCFKNGFTNWDDDVLVTQNTIIRELSWNNTKTIFSSFYINAYIPLTILSYSLEYHFFKLNPRAYHTTNLILHLLNCLLVFWLIYMLSKNIFISLATALLFGIHPLHVESVAWVTGRKDVLYSFFFLGALLAYLYYRKKQVVKYYCLSISLFILSVLAKGMAVTLPFVLFLCDYLLYGKFCRKILIEKIPFFAIAVVLAIITILGERSFEGLKMDSAFMFFDKILIASYGLIFYLTKIIMPVKLSCYYPYPEKTGSLLSPIFFFSCIIIVVLIIVVIFARKHTRKIPFGSSFFLITILPYLQLIPAGQLMADRYTYIPSIGLFFIVAAGFRWFYLKIKHTKVLRIILGITLIAIIGILSFSTWQRCKVWKNSITLWSDVLMNYPNVLPAYNNRGLAYYENEEHDKAIADFTQALKINPSHVKARYNRGNAYDTKGEYDRAIDDFTQAIRIDSNYARAYNNRGLAYGHKGEHYKAIDDFTQAIKIDAKYEKAYNNRGLSFSRIGEHYKAIDDFTQALSIDPKYTSAYYNRSVTYFMIKEYVKAWQDVRTLQDLGYKVNPEFLNTLRKISEQGDGSPHLSP